MLVHDRTNFNHRFDQLLGRQDITQPRGRIQDLAHCAGVDNTPGVIEPLQTWEWGTGITKFRVVIILENVSVTGARKLDQSRPSRETHRHPERELMGRSHVDDFWRALFRRAPDRDSFPVNRPWNDGRPGEPKHAASLVKSRIFDPCNLTPIYQGHRADHHCLLRPSRDDDLLWMTTCTSVIAQISC